MSTPTEANHVVSAPSAPAAHVAAPSQARPRRFRVARWLALFLIAALAVPAAWFWHQQQVRRDWHEALAALERHDLAAAATSLDRYLHSRPDDAAAWFLASRTARRAGKFADAERLLVRCQELAGITEATRLEWQLQRIQQGEMGDLHTRLRMSIGPEHPDAPLVLEALARGYQQCDRLQDALEACCLWIAIQPDHPWPRLWRGAIYEQKNSYHQALDDYQHANAGAPADRDARHALGALLLRARQPDAAAEHFEFLLKQPDDIEALVGLAGCRIEQARLTDAVELLERALAANPTQSRALYLRGKAALQLADAAAAERWLTQAAQHAPPDPETLHQLVLALRAQHKQAQAERLAVQLEALRRDMIRRSELVWLVAARPDDAGPRCEAGVLALRIGRTDEGVRWLQSALRAQGDRRPAHAALAKHFRDRSDPRAEFHERAALAP